MQHFISQRACFVRRELRELRAARAWSEDNDNLQMAHSVNETDAALREKLLRDLSTIGGTEICLVYLVERRAISGRLHRDGTCFGGGLFSIGRALRLSLNRAILWHAVSRGI
jgi:hypothetical protein